MPRRRRQTKSLGVLLALLLAAAAAVVVWHGGGALIDRLIGTAHAGPAAAEDGIAVYFSPKGGCTQAVVEEINAAQKVIWVQAYSFTSEPIAEALLRARDRGVQVTVILDEKAAGEHYSSARFCYNQHLDIYVDAKHPIAHNKIMILDAATVITGSFNFTNQAEQANAENLLILKGKPALVAAYQANFQHHLDHAERYVPGAEEKGGGSRGR